MLNMTELLSRTALLPSYIAPEAIVRATPEVQVLLDIARRPIPGLPIYPVPGLRLPSAGVLAKVGLPKAAVAQPTE